MKHLFVKVFHLNNIFRDITARLAYQLILNRPIDQGALEKWKDFLKQNPLHRTYLINSLFLSEEYRSLILADPLVDLIMMNYLHRERCELVRSLPAAKVILDIGGASSNIPRGALLTMGYPHPFDKLLIVDVPPQGSFEQRLSKEQYNVVQTELGEIRYIYKDMSDLAQIGLHADSIDLVWMGQTVEHIEEEKFDRLLSLIRQYLKPDGYFCFDTPNRRITSLQSPNRYIHPDHKIEYHFRDIVAKLKREDFNIVQTLGIGLSKEMIMQNQFMPAYIIENMRINQNPEDSYIFYFKVQKKT